MHFQNTDTAGNEDDHIWNAQDVNDGEGNDENYGVFFSYEAIYEM